MREGLETSSHGAEERLGPSSSSPAASGRLPAPAGGGDCCLIPGHLPTASRARGAQAAPGWMVTGDLKTVDIKHDSSSSLTGVFKMMIFQIQVPESE